MTRTQKPRQQKQRAVQRFNWFKHLNAIIPAVATLLQVYGLLSHEQASAWAALALTIIRLWLNWRAERTSHAAEGTSHSASHAGNTCSLQNRQKSPGILPLLEKIAQQEGV